MSMLRQFIRLMQETVHEWGMDGGAAIAASLAYYTIFSLSPLLIVVALFLGLVFDQNTLQTTVIEGLRGTLGESGAQLMEGMIREGGITRGDVFGTILWLAFVIWGASGAFAQLQTALNKIWEIKPIPGRSPVAIIRTRFFSFIIVILVGMVLFGIMVSNSLLNSFMIDNGTPALAIVVRPMQFVITVALTTLLIAAVFKLLPDAVIRWRDVMVGAAFTAVLFFIGQFAVGIYLSNATIGSVFGAAGSLTIILVWIYYSAQILLFGAEFTEVWARHHGAFIRPDADATWVNEYAAKRELKQAGKDYSGIMEEEQEKMARIEAGRARRAELARTAIKTASSKVRPPRRRGKVDTRTMQPAQTDQDSA
jgi:membrane protein